MSPRLESRLASLPPSRNDDPPRRKLNPWPIAIIGFFSLAIAGVIAFIIFATRNQMQLVRPDYYEEEIRYQEQVDRMSRTRALPTRAVLAYDRQQKQFVLALPMAHADRRAAGRIHFYRPSDSHLDRQVPLAVNPAGIQHVDARTFRTGLWKVRVYWTIDQQDYFFDESIVINPGEI